MLILQHQLAPVACNLCWGWAKWSYRASCWPRWRLHPDGSPARSNITRGGRSFQPSFLWGAARKVLPMVKHQNPQNNTSPAWKIAVVPWGENQGMRRALLSVSFLHEFPSNNLYHSSKYARLLLPFKAWRNIFFKNCCVSPSLTDLQALKLLLKTRLQNRFSTWGLKKWGLGGMSLSNMSTSENFTMKQKNTHLWDSFASHNIP